MNLALALGIFILGVWLTFCWLEVHTRHGEEITVPQVTNISIQQAIKKLEDAGLEYEVDSFKYDPKFKPYQVLIVYPQPGSKVKDGRTIILRVNPSTWAKVAVPDVLDRNKTLAFRQMELVGLKVGDTIYEPSISKDALIGLRIKGANIKPGTLLPKFTVLDVVIGTGPKRNLTIPTLTGMSVQQAREYITQNYFEIGLIDFEDGKKNESDIIYYQDPAPGAIRDQGMQIDLWASKKSATELQNKIQKLNNVYRIKIDTTQHTIIKDVTTYEAIIKENIPSSTTSPEILSEKTKSKEIKESKESKEKKEVKESKDTKPQKKDPNPTPVTKPNPTPPPPKKKVIIE